MYTVLFCIFFTISVGGIGTYFVNFHWYLKKDVTRAEFDICTQATIYLRYKWEKSKKLTLKFKPIIFK